MSCYYLLDFFEGDGASLTELLPHLDDCEWTNSMFRIVNLNQFMLLCTKQSVFAEHNKNAIDHIHFKAEADMQCDIFLKQKLSVKKRSILCIIHDSRYFYKIYNNFCEMSGVRYFVKIKTHAELMDIIKVLDEIEGGVGVFYLSMNSWFFYDFIRGVADANWCKLSD